MAGFIEGLESRTLLNGTVLVSVDHGALLLRGDAAPNALIIQRGGPTPADRTSFLLTPTDGTTLNGSAEPLVLRGIDAGMDIKLGAGSDQLTFDNVRVYGAVRIDAGQGDDAILVRSSRTTGGLTLAGGGGEDQLIVRKSTIQGELDIDGGLGRDRYLLSLTHGRNRLVLSDTDGQSLLYLNHLSVDHAAQFRTGNSIDHLMIDSSTFKSDVGFATTGGDDQVKVRGTVFHGASPIDGGSGTNSIDRQVILSWDFRNGEQGWRTGFSDYYSKGGEYDDHGNLLKTAEQAYQLQSGLRELPSDLKVDGTGMFFSGANHSDDLFMYLAHLIAPAQGTIPGARYIVSFRVRFASNEPAGLIGAGGPPAESLFLKMGASPRKPENYLDKSGDYQLNLHKGNQAFGGSEMSVAGNIANGDPPVLDDIYRTVVRRHTHPVAISANNSGNLWVAVGTDSGFEGITSLYYESVSVTLTPVRPAVQGGGAIFLDSSSAG